MLGFKGFVISILLTGCEFQTIPTAETLYHVEVEAFKYVKNASNIVHIQQLRVAKYNSTTNVINSQIQYTADLPLDTVLYVKAYQLLASNKYSMIPVGPGPLHFCDIIVSDDRFYPTFRNFSNFPPKCPFTKGDYWVKDFVPRFKYLPEQLPGERWRVDCDFISAGKMVVSFKFYVYLNRNI